MITPEYTPSTAVLWFCSSIGQSLISRLQRLLSNMIWIITEEARFENHDARTYHPRELEGGCSIYLFRE